MQQQQEPPSPEELLGQVACGCRDSFSELHGRYSKILHGIAIGVLREPFSANDAVQDSFLSIWNHASAFDPAKGGATSWMIRITRNTALDRLRKRKTRQRYMDAIPDLAPAAVHQSTPYANLMASERADGVSLMLDSLPRAQRLVLRLAYYEGLSQTEIADKLHEPVGTVKSRIRRAIRQMRCVVGVPRF